MKLSKLTEKQMKLLLEILNKGSVTSATQKTYWRYAFYLNITSLNDMGLVEQKGTEANNRKIWKLTEKGVKIATYLKKIEESL